jgi:hypothetical protein
VTAVLEASGLGKRYGRRWALADLTLAVPAGRVTGLVGPNGAGKTTLLQLAAGLLSLMLTWWSSPIAAAQMGARLDPGIFSESGITPAGRLASTEPATAACGPNQPSGKSCRAYIESLHLRQTVIYQPASRYWPLQWIETGIYLAFALLLAGLCFLRVRPGRSAEPDIHRPRAIRPAPALERSP